MNASVVRLAVSNRETRFGACPAARQPFVATIPLVIVKAVAGYLWLDDTHSSAPRTSLVYVSVGA